jgi:iron-sulfur cluster repair protein YtfE (RIC family)
MSKIKAAQRDLNAAVKTEILAAQSGARNALQHMATVTRDAEMPMAVAAEWACLQDRLNHIADELTAWAQRDTIR